MTVPFRRPSGGAKYLVGIGNGVDRENILQADLVRVEFPRESNRCVTSEAESRRGECERPASVRIEFFQALRAFGGFARRQKVVVKNPLRVLDVVRGGVVDEVEHRTMAVLCSPFDHEFMERDLFGAPVRRIDIPAARVFAKLEISSPGPLVGKEFFSHGGRRI